MKQDQTTIAGERTRYNGKTAKEWFELHEVIRHDYARVIGELEAQDREIKKHEELDRDRLRKLHPHGVKSIDSEWTPGYVENELLFEGCLFEGCYQKIADAHNAACKQVREPLVQALKLAHEHINPMAPASVEKKILDALVQLGGMKEGK